MKKGLCAMALAAVVMLSGCSVPFAPPSAKDAASNLIDASSPLAAASASIDASLADQLSKAKAGQIDFDRLIAEVEQVRRSQQEIYNTLKYQNASSEDEQAERAYLSVVGRRISSYGGFKETLSKKNYDMIEPMLQRHAEQDKQYAASALANVNFVLKRHGLPAKQSLS